MASDVATFWMKEFFFNSVFSNSRWASLFSLCPGPLTTSIWLLSKPLFPSCIKNTWRYIANAPDIRIIEEVNWKTTKALRKEKPLFILSTPPFKVVKVLRDDSTKEGYAPLTRDPSKKIVVTKIQRVESEKSKKIFLPII